jgi:hypothetical protein
VKFPIPIAETFAPVVIRHEPDTLNIPSGTMNGTRLETLDAPPAKIVILVALSRIRTLPGDVVAGTIKTPAR